MWIFEKSYIILFPRIFEKSYIFFRILTQYGGFSEGLKKSSCKICRDGAYDGAAMCLKVRQSDKKILSILSALVTLFDLHSTDLGGRELRTTFFPPPGFEALKARQSQYQYFSTLSMAKSSHRRSVERLYYVWYVVLHSGLKYGGKNCNLRKSVMLCLSQNKINVSW